MSDRSMWKMLHLLYTLRPGQRGLSDQQLAEAGIDCDPDTIQPLVGSGVASKVDGLYSLTEPTKMILRSCVVANRRWPADDMWVDHPSAFVVMPFSEPWSSTVFQSMIQPGITDAGLACIRGDSLIRVGDLTQNVWGSILHAGIVVADVTALNANVFYELGLAHALGKDAFILKQAGSKVPADIGGSHYYEYDPQSLAAGRMWLKAELSQWAALTKAAAVKQILGK